jgi:hypothetical protein
MPAEPSHICAQPLLDPMKTRITATAAAASACYSELPLVISDDVLRPAWLPPGTVWIPWGDKQMFPKTLFLRNTLPSPEFKETVQEAIAQGCGVDFNFPTPPTHDGVREAGECTQKVMGDYYPVAVWCNQQVLVQGGWKACLKEAGVQ